MRILLTEADDFPVGPLAQKAVDAAGIELVPMHGLDPEDMIRYGKDCDGVLAFHCRIDGPLLDRLPNWKVVARVGTGYDRVDVEACRERGIAVSYVPGAFTDELANLALALVLAFNRRLPFLFNAQSRGVWPTTSSFPAGPRLEDQVLGIVGLGPSGARLARKAIALGMPVRAWSRQRKPELCAELGIEEVSFHEVLANDYVSLHVALTPDTADMINEDALARFSRDGVLINISRGGLVNTNALVGALEEHRIGGAGLDVTDPEPLPNGHPLFQTPNTLLTMHTAALTTTGADACFAAAIEDAGRAASGMPVLRPVPES